MFGRFRKAKPETAPGAADEFAGLADQVRRAGLTLDTSLSPASFFRTYKDMRSTGISERYREFVFKARDHGLADIEQLVPFINVPSGPTQAEMRTTETDDANGARALLDAFPPAAWGYYMPLSRDYGTLGEKAAMNAGFQLSRRRSDYRLNFIFSGLEAVLGGSIGGKSVVDIACNWGGFSIEARLRGASEVLGFDIRPENIAKAGRMIDHFGLDGIDMRVQDLFTHQVDRQFDIVLNLGLMYHISQPFEMMKKTYEMTGEVAVIDTVVHRESFSGFILGTGEAAVGHAATAIGVELHPTYRGLIDMAYIAGFKTVIELHGLPDPSWPDFDKEPYGNKHRRCIVAFK